MYFTYTTRMMESRRDGFDKVFTAGHEDGLQQGAYENKLETAKTFLSMGFSPEQVAKVQTFARCGTRINPKPVLTFLCTFTFKLNLLYCHHETYSNSYGTLLRVRFL